LITTAIGRLAIAQELETGQRLRGPGDSSFGLVDFAFSITCFSIMMLS
jgi:hypothetical protein